MEAWTQQQTDGTRLLRIDVGEWTSPVATQFGIRRLPTLHLYDGQELVTSDTSDVLAQLQAR